MKKKLLVICAILVILCVGIGLSVAVNTHSEKNATAQKKEEKKSNSPKGLEAPIVVIPTNKDKQIKGSSAKLADVYIEINNKKIAEGKTDSKGKFAIEIPKQKKDTKIKVYTKQAGQQSLNTVVTVK